MAFLPSHGHSEIVPGPTLNLIIGKTMKVGDTDLPILEKDLDLMKFDNGYSVSAAVGAILYGGLEIAAEADYRTEKRTSKEGLSFPGDKGTTLVKLDYKNTMISGFLKASYYLDLGILTPYAGVAVGTTRNSIDVTTGMMINAGTVSLTFTDIIKKFKSSAYAEAGILFGIAEDMSVGVGGQYFIVAPLDKNDLESIYKDDKFLENDKDVLLRQIKTREWNIRFVGKIFI